MLLQRIYNSANFGLRFEIEVGRYQIRASEVGDRSLALSNPEQDLAKSLLADVTATDLRNIKESKQFLGCGADGDMDTRDFVRGHLC